MMLNELNDETFVKDIHHMANDDDHHLRLANMKEIVRWKKNNPSMFVLVELRNSNNRMDFVR